MYSGLKAVPKKGGSYRLICNLMRLNESIISPKFKNEGIDTVIELIRPQDCMVSCDLSDGFFHVPISKKN